ncbi:MBG domain-containing protein [Pseudomonas sp. QE6]|uniref:MBG domain-containing protein n=1 Tax=Pseudomonas sp. QE6 TaxID=3242491 RepID=UPI0035288C5B
MSTQSKAGKGHPCSPLTTLCIAVALASAGASFPVTYVLADNLPQGGQVIGGQATISQQGNGVDVNTSSARTAINWQRFNVGEDHKITFNQPDGKSVTLNRVIGGDPSKIYGAVTSNGQLILVNPNGIMVGPQAHISSSALVASAGFLTEEQAKQFAQTGKLDIALTGSVTNQGRITVHDNGMVALLGAQVNNAGIIQARKGMVQLATGPQATLDFHGDGLLNIAVSGEPGEKGSVNSDVTGGVHNSGEIDVGNGTVAMSSARAAKHLDSVINIGGNVVADSVTNDGGTIVLGSSAQTNVSGNISAKGMNGGQIKVLGDEVKVAGTAKIDASGTQGSGGKVLVGGSFQGKGPEQAAKNTTVAKGAQLKADGKTDGGQVVVWSDGKTHFGGTASAQGAQKGGEVETSGKQLTISPEAEVNASGGLQSGTWLLDPETVNIEANGGAPGSDTVSAAAIVNSLKNQNITISANNRINVNSAIVAQDAGFHVLKLQANGTVKPLTDYVDTNNPFNDAKRNDSGSVYINAPILLKDGHLVILATGDVMLKNTTGQAGGDAGYMGRAIIDVGSGTIWIKTSNSGSIIQDDGTALIGKKIAAEGASVLLDSSLNHAGTLAGKASNGKFIYNQTSSASEVNTGTVENPGVNGESMTGVGSTAINKVGEKTFREKNQEVHELAPEDGSEFQYLVFESGTALSNKQIEVAKDTFYYITSLTFVEPGVNPVTWVISATSGGVTVTRNGVNTNGVLPPGFSFGTNQGQVSYTNNGIGVQNGAGDINNPVDPNGINRNYASGTSDKLFVDLGSSTKSVTADLAGLSNGNPYDQAVVTFLSGQDTSKVGGVTLKNQTAQLEGKVHDVQRDYGDANPEFQASVGLTAGASENSKAVKGVDDFVDRQLNQNRFDTKVETNTAANEHSDVGQYQVDGKVLADGFVANRYQTSVQAGQLIVNPAELTVTAKDKSKTYGDADPKLDYELSGAKLGHTSEDLLNGGALSRQAGENVGHYGIDQGQLDLNNGLGGNYRLKFVDGQLQITPATLDVPADNQSKVYGDADPSLTYRVTGLKNGDKQTDVVGGGGLKRDAGENVSTYGITQGDLALLSSNYILQFHDGIFSITPAKLTVTANEQSKVYGDSDPALTFEVSGLKRDDTQSSVLNGGALQRDAGTDVGKYGIHQGTLDLNAAAGQNYVLHYVDGDFYITPATLTVQADGKTKVYGDLDPALTYIVSGLKNGDSQADVLGGGLVRDQGQNVGTYGIRQGDLDLTSGKGQNYVLSFTGNDFKITPATLTVSADDKTKVYGELDPELSYKVSGLKNGDKQSDVLNGKGLGRDPGQNVGDYGIRQGELGLSENSNYVLTFVDGKLAITPATLKVKAEDKSKVYGDADPALTRIVSGLKNGDTAADVLKGALGREAGEDVRAGGYTIHKGELGLNNTQGKNYVLEFEDGKLTITPTSLRVTADNTGKVYGDLDPSLSYQVSGLKGADTATQALAGQLVRQVGEDVKDGGYAINQGSLELNGKAAQNYILNYQGGTFTITPATIMVRADDKTKVYGEIDPALSYQVSGLKGGDQQSSVLSGNIARQAGEDVKAGGYAIGQGDLKSTSQNYLLQYVDGTFTITPATLQIDFDDHSKVYGEIDPSLTYRVSGLKNGDSAAFVISGSAGRSAGENVGSYGIGQGSLGSNGNYILTFNEGKLAITPAELTVTADHKTKVYGDLDPTLTYSVAGLKNGDSAASVTTGSLARISGENVTPEGYAITQGNVRLTSGNYTMVFKDGNLQVTPAPLQVTADNKTKRQGESDPTLTYSVSGLKAGDSASVIQGKLAREPGEEAGRYRIGQDGNFSAGTNYTVTFKDGAMTITGPLAPLPPEQPGLPPLPVTSQSPGNARCTAVESPSAVSANYSVSPAVIRTYAVQLICKPRSYGDKTSTVANIQDVLSYANSHFKDGKFIVPDWNRSVIPHDLKAPAKGGK